MSYNHYYSRKYRLFNIWISFPEYISKFHTSSGIVRRELLPLIFLRISCFRLKTYLCCGKAKLNFIHEIRPNRSYGNMELILFIFERESLQENNLIGKNEFLLFRSSNYYSKSLLFVLFSRTRLHVYSIYSFLFFKHNFSRFNFIYCKQQPVAQYFRHDFHEISMISLLFLFLLIKLIVV